MSCWVQVAPYGERYAVICTECGIDQQYPTYNRALNQCKAHTLFTHPSKIVWAN